MKMTRTISLILAFSALVTVMPLSAYADRDDRRGWDRHDSRPAWRGDIRHFHERDVHVWRGGHWSHGYHDGRLGWWWVVPTLGLWYWYSHPVYPYPDPYTPPVIVVPPTTPSAPPPAQYWYYCDASKTYYPYVQSCPGGWRMVPATPGQ